MGRGFGVAGALDHNIVKRLATEAERAGFATFWANDTPNGDGLESLAAAMTVTNTIRLGVGVIPVDRKPASRIVEQVRGLGLPEDRLTIGIGAGGLSQGALATVEAATLELKGLLTARILVGSLGPKMTRLGGAVADGVLLNWLTTDEAARSSELVRSGATEGGRSAPHIAAYIRVAFGELAYVNLVKESSRYESYPQYKRHFDKMGVPAIETTIFGLSSETLQERLIAYEDELDEVVVRAICAEETVEDYLALLRATAPN
jgi:alkanesulfonate monooxygenase SsuD/methylene tetrahydromethanopterin reductase-like flavin-dependent oxidoreductase (luciferase family)